MKTRTLITVLVFGFIFSASLMIPALSRSFQNESDGFMGLTWGADVSDLDGMVPVKKTPNGGVVYKKEKEALKIGSVSLTEALYSFSTAGKLTSVMSGIRDYKDFLALKKEFIDRYGAVDDPVDETEEKYIWTGDMTSIYLSYNRNTKTGILFAGAAAKKNVEEEEF